MSAKLLEGGPIAEEIKAQLQAEIAAMTEPLRLVALLIGDNKGAKMYAGQQQKASEEVGIQYELKELDESITQDGVLAVVDELNHDPSVTGIILLVPVPQHINQRAIQCAVSPLKDVDGVTPANLGACVQGIRRMAPCTAQAAVTLAERSGYPIEGAEVCMVGHSEIVGKPIALLLLDKFATITVCHIATKDVAAHTKQADILISAVGVKPNLVKAEQIKPGALVIDVGIIRVKDEETGKMKTVGDVEFDAACEVAGMVTPVPGGVGPLTVVMLLKNTVEAAKLQRA
jgi:methylenetetrahydrofolate dehydrogenase (NADP+)/methenyltetrahydrofolate cyclohydrolase